LPKPLHGHASRILTLSDQVTRHYFALLPAAQTLDSGEAAPSFRGAA
jgi:hypothetical protein